MASKKNRLKELISEGKAKRQALNDWIQDDDGEMLVADGLDAAIMGVTDGCMEPVVVYDYQKCIEIFMAEGMKEEDAMEHMSFNVTGGYVGSRTPIFVRFIDA